MKNKKLSMIPVEIIEQKIYFIRGIKVMIDKDLAFLYQVKPIALRQQVKRNKKRFPEDFMFQLTEKEVIFLVSQNVIPSKQVLGGFLPYAFTEHGVTMLSSVLKSKKAIEVNIAIIRAFIKLREMLQSHKDILIEIEKIKRDQKKHSNKISAIIDVINKLIEPEPEKGAKQIGFKTKR